MTIEYYSGVNHIELFLKQNLILYSSNHKKKKIQFSKNVFQ